VAELEMLQVLEVGPDGLAVWADTFDAADLAAAFEALDRRFLAGEAAPFAGVWAKSVEARRLYGTVEWKEADISMDDGFQFRDHRPVGYGVLSAQQYQALTDLAVGERLEYRHVRITAKATFLVSCVVGHVEGGPVEMLSLAVNEHDRDGTMLGVDVYSLD